MNLHAEEESILTVIGRLLIGIENAESHQSGSFLPLMDLPPHLFDEMKHFFSVYKALEGKQAVAKDVNDRAAAVQVIRQAMDHYAECFLGGPSAKVGLYPTEPDKPTAPEGKGK